MASRCLKARATRLALSVTLLATSLDASAGQTGASATLRHLQAEDARVAQVGWRLTTANRPLCADAAPRSGLVLYDAAQFGPAFRAAADALFGVSAGVTVAVVVPGSAADRAGIRTGDVLRSIGGAALVAEPVGETPSFAGVQRAINRLDGALATGAARIAVMRGGMALSVDVLPDKGCASLIQIVPSERRNASADGKTVTLTTASAEFARTPDELAALVAHELAHNVLRHRVRLDADGVSRGLFGGLGRSGRLRRAAEDEADRLSIHLLSRAGYDPAAAIAFWERFGKATQAIISDGTHANWRERVAVLQREIAALPSANRAACPPGFDFPDGACQP